MIYSVVQTGANTQLGGLKLGNIISELKFFGFDYFDYKGKKHLIARSGWS